MIVIAKEPSTRLRVSVDYVSDRYENEIVFVKENVLQTNNRCTSMNLEFVLGYNKSNLYEARVLFVFS